MNYLEKEEVLTVREGELLTFTNDGLSRNGLQRTDLE